MRRPVRTLESPPEAKRKSFHGKRERATDRGEKFYDEVCKLNEALEKVVEKTRPFEEGEKRTRKFPKEKRMITTEGVFRSEQR